MNPSKDQILLDDIAQRLIDICRDFHDPAKRYASVRNLLEHIFNYGALQQSLKEAEMRRREQAIDIQVLAGVDSNKIL